MFSLDDEAQAARFDEVASSPAATYRDVVEALGPNFEGGYFLYRFSDPTYVVASAVVRAVAGHGVEARRARAIDICGGSGHLTRSLLGLSSPPPVLADLYFSKIWLARRFTAPGCEAVCCDGNGPFPFARGTFRYAMCTDAFMYIWTKRLFVGEMARAIDDGSDGAILIGHTHNERTWSPSHGQPLAQDGYRNLFETIEPRIFGEAGLFADVVNGGPLDLSRRDSTEAIAADPALTIVASRHRGVFAPHRLDAPRPRALGELPAESAVRRGAPRAIVVTLRLQFPNGRLRAGVRRLPAVPARRGGGRRPGLAGRARPTGRVVAGARRAGPAPAGRARSAAALLLTAGGTNSPRDDAAVTV